jgi:hypothetical protein
MNQSYRRRYVIRIRAETDQFLLSCIELSTFNRWLECLFAAIDVALPIDDRDFPRDMSVPRVQRIRWYRGQQPSGPEYPIPTPRPLDDNPPSDQAVPPIPLRRRSSSPDPLPSLMSGTQEQPELAAAADLAVESGDDEQQEDDVDGEVDVEIAVPNPSAPPPRIEPAHRLSTSSYPNMGVDPHSGKWVPDHRWTSAHDMLYAKLCYSNLLFRSPRKSNYIISKGKKWYVDWGTGRMVRVMPPAYGEVDYFGPWQVIHTENMRI